MKRLILAAGLFVATVSTSLYAQTMDMQANIPFDFRIGNTVLPSGEYSIHHTNGMLFVSQTGGARKSSVVFTVGTDHPNAPTEKGTLQFNRYGDSYYLSKIWTPDSRQCAGSAEDFARKGVSQPYRSGWHRQRGTSNQVERHKAPGLGGRQRQTKVWGCRPLLDRGKKLAGNSEPHLSSRQVPIILT